jgi:hypothetical protein
VNLRKSMVYWKNVNIVAIVAVEKDMVEDVEDLLLLRAEDAEVAVLLLMVSKLSL